MQRRRGPRPGSPDTRGEILAAARAEFGAAGFDGTSIRAVAERAAVDSSLVHHYFRTKIDLFREAVRVSIDPGEVPSWGTPARGAALAEAFLAACESPGYVDGLVAVIRSAGASDELRDDDDAFAELGRFVGPHVVGDPATRELRVDLAVGVLCAAAVGRYALRLSSLTEPSVEELVTVLAPVLQQCLEGDIEPPV